MPQILIDMISAHVGLPGAGKGFYSTLRTVDELRSTDRPIITNFAYRVMPWIRTLHKRNGRYRHEDGFMTYLANKYGETFDVENRIHVLTDEQFEEFYLWRVNFDGELVKIDAIRNDKGLVVDFDKAAYAKTVPCVYNMDEAWKFVWARNWQKFAAGMQMYVAQHRHAGDDLWLQVQTEGQIDKAIRDMVQEWHSLVNHKHRKIGLFKQPNVVSVIVSNERPSMREKTLSSLPKVIRFDASGIGGSFDTASAMGGSSVAADIEKKPKGLPTWGIVVAILLFGALIVTAAKGAGWMSGKLLTGTFRKNNVIRGVAPGAQEMSKPWNPLKLPVPAQRQAEVVSSSVSSVQVDSIYMVGFATTPVMTKDGFYTGGKLVTVFLSDGSEYNNGDGHLQYLCPHYCVVDGVTNRYRCVVNVAHPRDFSEAY